MNSGVSKIAKFTKKILLKTSLKVFSKLARNGERIDKKYSSLEHAYNYTMKTANTHKEF